MKISRPKTWPRRRPRFAGPSCLLALVFKLACPQRGGAEDHVEFKYEQYQEDRHRVEVNTGLLQFEKSITAALTIKGQMVYDSISGASPTGGPPPAGSPEVPVARLADVRYAATLELSQRWGNHAITPQLAFSTESDYDSYGISLTDAIEFNRRNTTLTLGATHNFDTIYKGNSPYLSSKRTKKKDTTDLIAGVTQLLGPKTILTINGTYGWSEGYLSDPTKASGSTVFPTWPERFCLQTRGPPTSRAKSSSRASHNSSRPLTRAWKRPTGFITIPSTSSPIRFR